MYNISIPEISREELLARYNHIKPVIKWEERKYFLSEFTEEELTKTSYLWMIKERLGEEFDITKYSPMQQCDFECIHKFGMPNLFKPSIGEVLAQIPKLVLDDVCAFEIIQKPESEKDLYRNKIAFDNGFHTSIVRLYTRVE